MSSSSSISTDDCADVAWFDNVEMKKKNEHGQEDESTLKDGITAMIVHGSAGFQDEPTTQNKEPTSKKQTFDSLDAGI
ncbi:hypothetical protein ACA910_019410 [Epithemia clementina (nom. ined.)]